MKTVFNLLLLVIVSILMSGCTLSTTSDTANTDSIVVNNTAYIPFSSSATSRKDVLYKTDGTATNTNLVPNSYLPSASNNLIASSIGSFLESRDTLLIQTQVLRGPCLVGCNLTYGYLTLNLQNDAITQPSITKVTSSLELNSFLPSYAISDANGIKYLYLFASHLSGQVYTDIKFINTTTNSGPQAISNPTQFAPYMLPLASILNDNGTSMYVSAYKTSGHNGDITDFGILHLNTSTNTFSLVASGYHVNSFAFSLGSLYFIARDHTNAVKLFELDPINGVIDLLPISVGAERLYSFNGSLYFIDANTIYKYDIANDSLQTLLTTSTIIGTNSNSSKYGFGGYIEFNNKLYLYADNNLFEIDGTNNTASNITPNLNISDNIVYRANGKLYFGANDGINGLELWQYDGTTASMVLDINPGVGDSTPRHITELNGNIVFQATPNGVTNKLYTWDGTTLTPLN